MGSAVLSHRRRGRVTDAVVGAQVAIAAVGRLDGHFHLETLAAPANRPTCE